MFHHAKNVWNKRVMHVYTCFNSGLRKLFSRSLIQCIQSNIIPDRKLGIATLSEKKGGTLYFCKCTAQFSWCAAKRTSFHSSTTRQDIPVQASKLRIVRVD